MFRMERQGRTKNWKEEMIDPITLGIAFTAAQQSVGYIKKAIALGKDVNSLYGQFAKFFENSDTIHSANITAQNNNTTKENTHKQNEQNASPTKQSSIGIY